MDAAAALSLFKREGLPVDVLFARPTLAPDRGYLFYQGAIGDAAAMEAEGSRLRKCVVPARPGPAVASDAMLERHSITKW